MSDSYLPPIVTVECLLFEIIAGKLSVFVGQISGGDHDRQWAMPGGFCQQGESMEQALQRIMADKAGIDTGKLEFLEQLQAFDNPHGETGQQISIVFLAAAYRVDYRTDYLQAKPQFTPIDALPNLAYLQSQSVNFGLQKLKELLATTTVGAALLPEHFTLTALQQVYELAYGRTLDKRNFRKKFLSYGILEDTGTTDAGAAHRPAKLYRFKQPAGKPLQPVQF